MSVPFELLLFSTLTTFTEMCSVLKNPEIEAGEMAPSVKSLLWTCEGLNSIPRFHVKKLRATGLVCNTRPGKEETRGSLGPPDHHDCLNWQLPGSVKVCFKHKAEEKMLRKTPAFGFCTPYEPE